MRALVTALALSTTLLTAACTFLLWRSGELHSALDAALADEASMEARIAELVAERARTRDASPAVPCYEPANAPVVGRLLKSLGGSAGSPAELGTGSGSGRSLLDRLTPEQKRTMVRQRYGVLFHELGLSDPEIDALLPVLAAQDDRARSHVETLAPVDPTVAEEREREVAAVLGAEKAATFSELRRGMSGRMEVGMIRMDLEQAGTPMSEEQQRQLLAILKDLDPPPPLQPREGEPPETMMERFHAWRTERANYLREKIAPSLSERQLQRLDENEALRTALRQAVPPRVFPPPAPAKE